VFWEKWWFVEDEGMLEVIGEVVVRMGSVVVTMAEDVVVGLVTEFCSACRLDEV
jgi:hypothetical protein